MPIPLITNIMVAKVLLFAPNGETTSKRSHFGLYKMATNVGRALIGKMASEGIRLTIVDGLIVYNKTTTLLGIGSTCTKGRRKQYPNGRGNME